MVVMMQVSDVLARVGEVRACADGASELVACTAGDPEMAHTVEIQLWRDVLEAIADGADDPAALARAALYTQEIKFERWLA